MGGGNGMKSKTKRERNQAKDVNKGNTSQLAKNREAMNIICKVCRQKSLEEHVNSKHAKLTLTECFPHLAQ